MTVAAKGVGNDEFVLDMATTDNVLWQSIPTGVQVFKIVVLLEGKQDLEHEPL